MPYRKSARCDISCLRFAAPVVGVCLTNVKTYGKVFPTAPATLFRGKTAGWLGGDTADSTRRKGRTKQGIRTACSLPAKRHWLASYFVPRMRALVLIRVMNPLKTGHWLGGGTADSTRRTARCHQQRQGPVLSGIQMSYVSRSPMSACSTNLRVRVGASNSMKVNT